MRPFDRDVWVERASRRVARTQDQKRFSSDINGIRGLTVLTEWCREQGLGVMFTRITGGEYDPDKLLILVTSAAPPERQLHVLLHEVGHHLYEMDRKSRSQPATRPPRKRTAAYVIDELREEFAAWELGRRLAQELGLALTEKFDRYRVRCLISYVGWAHARGRGYEED